MKHEIKKSLFVAVALTLLFSMFLPLRIGLAAALPEGQTCDQPSAYVTMQSTNAVSFAWDAVSGATEYRVWYVREQDNYTSEVTSTGNTNITYSNLPAGTYRFYFTTVCGMVSSGSYVIPDLIIV